MRIIVIICLMREVGKEGGRGGEGRVGGRAEVGVGGIEEELKEEWEE